MRRVDTQPSEESFVLCSFKVLDKITMTSIQPLLNFAIIFIYTLLFGTAAFEKWKSLSTPEWFNKQFEKTFINRLPGKASIGYWFIASFEAILTLLFIVSIFNFAFLSYALIGSLFLFGILLFGLRITYDFQGSANMFIYFGTTLVSLFFVLAHS